MQAAVEDDEVERKASEKDCKNVRIGAVEVEVNLDQKSGNISLKTRIAIDSLSGTDVLTSGDSVIFFKG